ncbi:hypothetical protein TYRP_010260 [Tyrophagus putrescentiae]|nr:hypothetical protein TYRP_010260 [Tyrophagus putrescentiae]
MWSGFQVLVSNQPKCSASASGSRGSLPRRWWSNCSAQSMQSRHSTQSMVVEVLCSVNAVEALHTVDGGRGALLSRCSRGTPPSRRQPGRSAQKRSVEELPQSRAKFSSVEGELHSHPDCGLKKHSRRRW